MIFPLQTRVGSEGNFAVWRCSRRSGKVNPDLVVRDKERKLYSVRYEQVNAMLLNEFLKEHQKVEDLKGLSSHGLTAAKAN
jgi:hypothetical protein